MPDRNPKPDRPTLRKEKLCKTCGRPFAFRPEHSQDWDIVKFCSDTCRSQKIGAPPAESKNSPPPPLISPPPSNRQSLPSSPNAVPPNPSALPKPRNSSQET